MCWLCEEPSRTFDDYLDQMRDRIDRYGWAVQFVEGEGVRSSFAYTVGLTPHGLPELAVTGLEPDQVGVWVNGPASACLQDRKQIRPGSRRPFADGVLTEALVVSQPAWHLRIAATLYGSRIRATQLVWQDSERRWPWDRDFRDGRGGQPVLGPRAVRLG